MNVMVSTESISNVAGGARKISHPMLIWNTKLFKQFFAAKYNSGMARSTGNFKCLVCLTNEIRIISQFQNLRSMLLGIYLLDDIGNDSILINQKSNTGSSHKFLAIPLLLNPHAILLVDRLVGVGY
jgi:hypothetical protein